jgi:hypothetical protein
VTDQENANWRAKIRLLRLPEDPPPPKKRKGGPGRPRIISNEEQVKWILGHIAGGYRFREIPAVGCSRWTWWRTVRRDPEVTELQQSAREWRRKHLREYGGLRRRRQRNHPFCTRLYSGARGRPRPTRFREEFIDLVGPSLRSTAPQPTLFQCLLEHDAVGRGRLGMDSRLAVGVLVQRRGEQLGDGRSLVTDGNELRD